MLKNKYNLTITLSLMIFCQWFNRDITNSFCILRALECLNRRIYFRSWYTRRKRGCWAWFILTPRLDRNIFPRFYSNLIWLIIFIWFTRIVWFTGIIRDFSFIRDCKRVWLIFSSRFILSCWFISSITLFIVILWKFRDLILTAL